MDINEDLFHLTEFQISTESGSIFEYVTTVLPFDVHVIDQVQETNNFEVDGTFILYGMGGILAFFVIYMLCYSYCIHLKEREERNEMELRRLYEENMPYRRPPMNDGRIFIEDFQDPSNPNTVPQNGVERNMGNRFNPFCAQRPIKERIFYPEDFQDQLCPSSSSNQVESFHVVSETAENSASRERDLEWMSTPPLGSSTPQESDEKIFSPEDVKDILYPIAQQTGDDMNLDHQNTQKVNVTPPKDTLMQSLPASTIGSRSSPTSPDIIRRRLSTSEGIPRRPFSWQ